MFEGKIGLEIDPSTQALICLPTITKRTTLLFVSNATGLHLRLAARLAKAAQAFVAEVKMECDGRSANAKSMIDILTLGIGQGACITVNAKGRDADQAICTIEKLFACFAGSSAEEPAGQASPWCNRRGGLCAGHGIIPSTK